MSSNFIRITVVLGIIGITTQWLLSSFQGVISSVIQIVIISVVFAGIVFLFRRSESFLTRCMRNMLILFSVHGIFGLVLIFFSVYSNSFPGSVSKIILSNNSGSIVFLQMSHVGTESFYETIEYDIRTYSNSGYIIYAEGVRPGSMKSQNQFDQILGVKMGSGLYDSLAHMIGLQAQDASLYKHVPKVQFRNVDISIDDIVSLIGTGSIPPTPPIDLESELRVFSEEHPTAFLGYVIRGILNSMLRSDGIVAHMDFGVDSKVMDVLLHVRNAHIVDTLYEETNGSGVVLVYGALHFQGVYELLRARDSSWRIESIEPRYPYR